MKKALITGVTVQYSAYMSKFLLSKDYEMHEDKQRSSLFNTDRFNQLYHDPGYSEMSLVFENCDFSNSNNLLRIIQQVQLHEIYKLSAMLQTCVTVKLNYRRSIEVDLSIRYISKATTRLGQCCNYDLSMFAKEIAASDKGSFQNKRLLKKAGHIIKN